MTHESIDPHVRPIDPWRDGSAIADLLELCFREEGMDDSGRRMIRMLRDYGPLESLIMEGAPGFVWVEDGRVIGNVSVQRNPIRRDTWIVGNVATHPAQRNRGIATALMGAVLRFAQSRGARQIALQVMEGNAPAVHLYEKYGFRTTGAVTAYQRQSVHRQPVWRDVSAAGAASVRRAKWHDSASVWQVTCANIPPALTYAEPFDQRLYQLGLRWTLSNWFNGNCERWLVAESNEQFVGAIRLRVNFELSEHHVELMLSEHATENHGICLLEQGLRYFDVYTSKPLLATQSRPHEPSHSALQAAGFKPQRTLLHMIQEVGKSQANT